MTYGLKNSFEQAQAALLSPAELKTDQLERLLHQLPGRVEDHYADLYFQQAEQEVWALEQGVVKDASFRLDRGVGARVVSGEKTGFACSDEFSFDALKKLLGAAAAISVHGGTLPQPVLRQQTPVLRYPPLDPIPGWTSADKVALLQSLDRQARAADPSIQEVNVSLSGVHEVVLIAASDGALAADVRPLIRLNVSVLADRKGRRERGSAGIGGRHAYDWLLDAGRASSVVQEAVRQALINLDAKAAPAGSWPVVLGAGWPGVLLHEAVGHGLEGDFNRKGTSVFAGQIGEMVASPLCTVVDDATLDGRRGSLSVDDEGTAGECTTLIEKGRLVGYMQDKLNARLMGTKSTGNGRRESYASQPMPRMTNTFMLAGESDPADIIASLDKGLYAPNLGGGQVDITSGRFVFSTSEAYWVEKGRILYPVKGATLIGSGIEVMRNISMVGNDLALDRGVGVCGKDGQSVPVGVGQPTLRVEALTVGGSV
jgi:TldD protein